MEETRQKKKSHKDEKRFEIRNIDLLREGKVKFNKKTKKPHVICYRYISPNSKRKIYIKIKEKDFNKFKPV